MKLRALHRWDLSPTEAMALQRELAPEVICGGSPADVRLVAAVDVAYVERAPAWAASTARAALVLMSHPDMVVVEQHLVEAPVMFPYVPGLLSFREVPALALAFEKLAREPDLLLVDGHGFSHPRRFGLASHLGLLTGVPTIGCAKSRLCGVATDPAPGRGSITDLVDGTEVIGRVVRTKDRVKPLFVSVGHMIGLAEAADWVLRLALTHRLPQPIRLADLLSKGHVL